jgi:DNA-binding transcriptional MerR regulator
VVFTIGPFSRLAGVSPRVLRTYDAAGLFRPVWTDPSSGYRFYSPAQLPEIRRVLGLRDLGIGVAEIGRLVNGGTDLRAVLDRRRAELERERREIERRLATLDIRIGAGAAVFGGAVDSAMSDVVVRPLTAELVAQLPMADRADPDIGAAYYELESLARDQGRRANRPPGIVVGADEEIVVYVPISGPIQPSGTISQARLPACRAATLIVRGPYEAITAARETLERWADAAGVATSGPLRIIYLQFGAESELSVPSGYVVDRAADFVTELQLPVV